MQLRGIDISSWSHGNDEPIDFAQVKSQGFGFVMIKSTQGTTYKNPYLAEDAVEAHHNGLLVGTYHYAVPGEDDAILQAKFAAAAVIGLPLSLGVALDLEEQGTLELHQLGPWAQAFMSEMNSAGHQSPFYTNENYLSQLPGAPWGHKLWYASEHLPEYQTKLAIWMQQTTQNDHLPGVPGPVDYDVFYGVRGQTPPANTSAARGVLQPPVATPTGETPAEEHGESSTTEHSEEPGTPS